MQKTGTNSASFLFNTLIYSVLQKTHLTRVQFNTVYYQLFLYSCGETWN